MQRMGIYLGWWRREAHYISGYIDNNLGKGYRCWKKKLFLNSTKTAWKQTNIFIAISFWHGVCFYVKSIDYKMINMSNNVERWFWKVTKCIILKQFVKEMQTFYNKMLWG